MPTIELTEEQSRILNGANDATVLDTGGRRYRLTSSTDGTADGSPSDTGQHEDRPLNLSSDDSRDWRGPRPVVTAEMVREVSERFKANGPFFTTEEVFSHLRSLDRDEAGG